MTKLYLNLTDIYGLTECSIQLNIYAFDGNYNNTLATEPIYGEYITSSYRTYTVEFEDGQMTAGDYLVVLSYVEPEDSETDETESSTNAEEPNEIHSKVVVDNFWYKNTLPEEYEQYNLRSYTKDKANKKTSFCGGFVIEYNQTVTEIETEDETEEKREYPENTAKVILLGGQSNATGASYGSFLKEKISSEQYEEYVNGYSNVKILYSSGTLSSGVPSVRNKTSEFVDTKLGQGISGSAFGPELGLAAYLSKTYPDETFYIIKYAIGGSGLYAHWNPEDEEKNSCLVEFKETVDRGLELLDEMGLDPRIVGFVWMQGESDASTLYRAHEYYRLQKALVEDIRNEYGFYEGLGGIAFIDAAVPNIVVRDRNREFSWSTNIYEASGLENADRRPVELKPFYRARNRYIAECQAPADLEGVKAILSDHSVPHAPCRHGKEANAVTAWAMYCLPEKGVVGVADGNPCCNPFTEYSL